MALVTLATPAAAQVDEPSSVTPSVTTATLPASSSAKLVYPLLVVGPAPTDAVIDEVTLGGAAVDPSVADAIEATIDARKLTLSVMADEVPEQGTYSVLLSVTTGVDQLPLTVTFTRPAVTLTGPTTLTLVRTIGPDLPWLAQVLQTPDSDPVKTSLRVDSGRLLTASSAPQDAVEPSVTATPTVHSDAATLDLSATTNEDDLGSFTRTVDVVSPQLGAPRTITIEVRNRLSLIWIGAILVLAVIVGWLVRTLLPWIVAGVSRSRARIVLQQRLHTLLADVPDADVAKVVRAQERRVSRWFVRASTIDDAARTVEGALTDLETRISGQDARRRRLANAVRHRKSELTSVTENLSTVRRNLDRAKKELTARDARAAEGSIDEALSLAQHVGQEVDDALRYAAGDMADLTRAVGTRTLGAQGTLARRLTVLAERLAVPDAPQQTEEAVRVDRVDASLDRTHVALQTLETGVLPALNGVADEAAWVARHQTNSAGTSQAVASIVAESENLRTAATAQPAPAFQEQAQHLQALNSAYAQLLNEIYPAGPGRDSAMSGLNTGDVQQAIAGSHLSSTRSSDLGVADAGTPPVAGTPYLDATPVSARVWFGTLPAQAATFAFSASGFAIHAVVAGLLVLASGYALFAAQWIGTYTDVYQVFAWGITVDISLAGLIATVTKTAEKTGTVGGGAVTPVVPEPDPGNGDTADTPEESSAGAQAPLTGPAGAEGDVADADPVGATTSATIEAGARAEGGTKL